MTTGSSVVNIAERQKKKDKAMLSEAEGRKTTLHPAISGVWRAGARGAEQGLGRRGTIGGYREAQGLTFLSEGCCI